MCWHRKAFTHSRFTHRRLFTQSLLHTDFLHTKVSFCKLVRGGHFNKFKNMLFTITTPWLSLFSFINFRRGKLPDWWSNFAVGVPPHLCYRRVVFQSESRKCNIYAGIHRCCVFFFFRRHYFEAPILLVLAQKAHTHTSRNGRVSKVPPSISAAVFSDHRLLSLQHHK